MCARCLLFKALITHTVHAATVKNCVKQGLHACLNGLAIMGPILASCICIQTLLWHWIWLVFSSEQAMCSTECRVASACTPVLTAGCDVWAAVPVGRANPASSLQSIKSLRSLLGSTASVCLATAETAAPPAAAQDFHMCVGGPGMVQGEA